MKKNKKPFNPNDFDIDLKVKDVVEKFPLLMELDFKKLSLNDELVKLNYEIVSKEYTDKKYSLVKDYYNLDVDYIV